MDGSQKERNDLLEAYETLRVADVRDGLDWNMAHHWGTVDTAIRPLYRTRICGIARTARYVPYEGPIPKLTPEEYTEWSDWYYRAVCTFDFINEIEDGDVIMIDQSSLDVGLIGSNSGLAGFVKGARGYVTNGGVRDTDELILEKVPFWSRTCAQPMVQGRLKYDSRNVPVDVGGVVVNPGDVVVADGDGVVVVPRKVAFEVAKYATQELNKDKTGRRKLYEDAGLPLDDTVR